MAKLHQVGSFIPY